MNLKKAVTEAEWLARVDLAAFHRLVASYGWDDLLLAHLSCRVPGEDAYLINPFGLLFEEITASSLLKVDYHGCKLHDSEYEISPGVWGRYEVRLDTAFEAVVRGCAEAPRPGGFGTWITADMRRAYVRLHTLGFAHSAEAWEGECLAGGLYGVSLGGVFFGESMFAARPDASKVAFVALVRQLQRWGFDLVDCQMQTSHLERFGAGLWPRRRFLETLAVSLERETRRGRWCLEPSPSAPGAAHRTPLA